MIGQISRFLRSTGGGYSHWCPGCEHMHIILTSEPQESGARWSFNGNVEKPTFTPSVLIRSGHYANGDNMTCWCTYERRFGKPAPFECTICHYNLDNGVLTFHGDSTHKLRAASQVPLPELPEHVRD